ncbi:MAG: BspA family leucine-rich repeat surface protein, partial [Deltaproteobacteria bacterium]
MVKILQIIFFSLLITMMNGCSRPKKKTETTFKLTGSSLVNGTQMQGGIFLWAKPVDPQFPDFKAVLDADDTALIPFGEYNLHIVGYEGPNAWSGNTQCGGTPGPTIIEGPEVTITINLTTAACDAQPYIDMIAEIANGGTTTTPASTDMITVWQTTIANETITLPLTNTGTYNFTVDWGDGTPIQTITTWNQAETTHTYVAAGTYTVTMSGTATEWRSFLAASASKLIQVQNLGDMGWTNLSSAFDGCSNLTSFAGGKTNLVTTMLNMFKNTSSLTSLDLSSFDTSNVTIMEGMFRGASSLTSLDLSSFNTSNVTTMASMFSGASSLTSLDLSSFNTSNVTTMTAMFSGAS